MMNESEIKLQNVLLLQGFIFIVPPHRDTNHLQCILVEKIL